MKHIEGFLREYWYLMKDRRRLNLDVSLARHAYEQSALNLPSSCRYSVVKSKNREIAKPVEISAMIMIDEYRAAVESIDRELKKTEAKIKLIEDVVQKACLDFRQREYIKLRYFQNVSAEAVSQRLYCSSSTCRRMRRSALEAISKAMEPETEMRLLRQG